MTLRSIITGLLCTAVLAAVTYFNDWVLCQTHMVGNHMPVSVYGAMIFFVFVVNRLLKSWAYSGREIAVVMALVLAGCAIPGSGLLRTFTCSLVMPHHYERLNPSWQHEGVLDDVPAYMLADVSEDEDLVLNGYLQGLSTGSEHMPISRVPWFAWMRTFRFWVPLVLTIMFMFVSLSVIVHRQWSRHEHLPYPIATFADALLPEPGRRVPMIFSNRLFWIGLGVVALIHCNNFAAAWFPQTLIRVTTSLDFRSLAEFFPSPPPGIGQLFMPTIYFTVIGIAFFIPKDVGAAFAFGPYLWAWVASMLVAYGINPNAMVEGVSAQTGISIRLFVLFGASLGLFMVLLYAGRHYYASNLRRAFGVGRADDSADPNAVWGFRAFFLFSGLSVGQLCLAGIAWPFALLYMAVLVIIQVVMARVVAEGGMFHLKTDLFPCVVLWGIFGAGAIGPRTLLLMQLVTVVVLIDPREALMPFLVNANKLLELRKASIRRVAPWTAVAVALALAVGLPVTLYIQYDTPQSVQNDRWAFSYVPRMAFDNSVNARQKLKAMGTLPDVQERTAVEQLASIRPNVPCMIGLGVGLLLVLVSAVGRLRFSQWPLHPLFFVLWASDHARHFAFSFLIGVAIKHVVMKYGAGTLYNKLKPLMFGVIAGEVAGAILPSVVGAIYYFITNESPTAFRVLPT